MRPEQRIKRIAWNVRRWTENLQAQEPNNSWDEDLTCMCGIASYELFKRLKRAGFKPAICFADAGHAFVKCNRLIVDVTATQFSSEYASVEIRESRFAKTEF